MKKEKAQRIHFKRRWSERVGALMTNTLHDQIVRKIRNGETRLVYKRTNRISVHRVEVEGVERDIVYDKLRKVLVTVLPKEDSNNENRF